MTLSLTAVSRAGPGGFRPAAISVTFKVGDAVGVNQALLRQA